MVRLHQLAGTGGGDQREEGRETIYRYHWGFFDFFPIRGVNGSKSKRSHVMMFVLTFASIISDEL